LFYETIPQTKLPSRQTMFLEKPASGDRDYHPEIASLALFSENYSKEGAMAITDTQYFRVLLWDHWQRAFDQPRMLSLVNPTSKAMAKINFS
jgi:hypothetical protein